MTNSIIGELQIIRGTHRLCRGSVYRHDECLDSSVRWWRWNF